MRNDSQLNTAQITRPCIINEKLNQHNQGQDDKAEGGEISVPSFSSSAHEKMIRTTTLHCKPGMNRPLRNTLKLNLMLEIVPNLNFWLQFCLHTSSILRGEKVNDIAADKVQVLLTALKHLISFIMGN